MGNFSDSVRNIERNTKSAADSAAFAARSNAATSRAAQSAATGAWVGAGFQAVAAFHSARAAQAAEEELELQRVRNEQDRVFQFGMWSQTPNGIAFVSWRERAVSLAQFLRDREAMWLSAWARAIGRAQAATPDAEKHRFLKRPARLKQKGLKVAAILSLAIAALYTVNFLFQILMNVLPSDESAGGFTYEQCLTALKDPENLLFSQADCDAISPYASMPLTLFPLIFFLGLGVAFLVLRRIKQRAARADLTVAHEAQLRIERWGFDPLAVRQGYTAFPWSQSWNPDEYADQLMRLALHGHVSFPAQSELIKLAVPESYPPSRNYPAEVNEVLEKFQNERPPLG